MAPETCEWVGGPRCRAGPRVSCHPQVRETPPACSHPGAPDAGACQARVRRQTARHPSRVRRETTTGGSETRGPSAGRPRAPVLKKWQDHTKKHVCKSRPK